MELFVVVECAIPNFEVRKLCYNINDGLHSQVASMIRLGKDNWSAEIETGNTMYGWQTAKPRKMNERVLVAKLH